MMFILDASGYSDETKNTVVRFAKYFARSNRKIIKFIMGVIIMLTYTLQGIKNDLGRVVDRLAIRLINFLDMVRGDFDYGKEEK